MPLSQLQGLTPLGGTPNYGANSTSSNADGTDPNDPNAQQKRRATFQRAPSSSASDTNASAPQQRTFAQMSQAGIARPAPPSVNQAQIQAPQAPSPSGGTVSTQPVGQPRAVPAGPPLDTNPAGQLPLTPPLQATVGMQNNLPRSVPTGPPLDTNPSTQPPQAGTPGAFPTFPSPTPGAATPPAAAVAGAPSSLTDAVTQAVMGGMQNPSAFNSSTVQQIIDAENQQLALDQTAGRRSIDETMAARGLYDSTAAGDKYGQLQKAQDAQRAQLDATLAGEAAQTYGADRTAAINAGAGVQGQLAGQGLAQQAQNLNSALGYANATGTINGAPTLAAQQLQGQLGLGQSQIDASLLNAERSQLGTIASAGLLSDKPTPPDSSWINFLTGGQLGTPASGGGPPLSQNPADQLQFMLQQSQNALQNAANGGGSGGGASSTATSVNNALGYGSSGGSGSSGGLTFPGGSNPSQPSDASLVTPQTLQARASGQISPIQRYATPDELKTIQYQGPNGQMVQAQPGDQIVLQPTANGQWTPVTRNGQPTGQGQTGIYTFDYNNPARYGLQPFSYAPQPSQ